MKDNPIKFLHSLFFGLGFVNNVFLIGNGDGNELNV